MLGAERAVQLCCTSDLQRRRAPKSGKPNVHVICEKALKTPHREMHILSAEQKTPGRAEKAAIVAGLSYG